MERYEDKRDKRETKKFKRERREDEGNQSVREKENSTEREGYINRERERERETDRQTDRQTERKDMRNQRERTRRRDICIERRRDKKIYKYMSRENEIKRG